MVATVPATDTNNEAHAILQAAHEAGYRFPVGFHGFSGDIEIIESTAEGTRRATGTVIVGGPRAIQISVEGDESLQQWGRQEIASMAGHRWPTNYEESDGRYELVLGDDLGNPLGRELTFTNDPYSSSYRVADGRITQVTRAMGPMRFTITMQRHIEAADGRLLPEQFTVSYWNTIENRLTRSDIYSDRYAVVDLVSVPASRTVVTAEDAGFTTRRLVLSNVTLLKEVAALEEQSAHRHGTRAG